MDVKFSSQTVLDTHSLFPHGFYMERFDNEPVDLVRLDMVEKWCADQFGDVGWFRFGVGFWFISRTDATAFKLRWL